MPTKTNVETIQGRLLINDSDRLRIIPVHEVIRIESLKDSCRIVLVNGVEIVPAISLDAFSKELEKHSFFRIHADFLINLNFLKTFSKKDKGSVLMEDESELPVSNLMIDELVFYLVNKDLNIITN